MNQTILDRNNQSIAVDLICYFSNNSKKYIFYNKKETVQDGLIKMYVSEENTGLTSDITQEEWTNLKKIMQGIIMGNMVGVEFLAYNNPVVFNEPKVIALNDVNINAIKTAYNNAVGISEPVLNKDILSQSFGSMESTSTPEPVQLSSIPNVQNNFNMEATPVNLNTNPLEITNPTLNTVEPVVNNNFVSSEGVLPNMESSNVPEIPSIESTINESALNINSIKPGGIDSGFKVSNEPNIFDNPVMPYQITEEEINNASNVFNSELSNMASNNVIEDSKEDTINKKKIELNERKIKLFEELASVYREENQLLNNNYEDSPLERTASNLFNSNGSLNDNEVLN